MYKSFGGTVMSRKSLVCNIVQYFKGDLIVLSSPGLSNVLVFKEEAAKHMKMVTNDCEGSEDSTLKAIAKIIKEESMSLKHDHKSYKTGIDRDKAMNDCSPTLLRLLTFICEKFDSKLTAATIGNIITAMVNNQPTAMQVALGVVINEKSHIELLNKLGVTCTYDELLRFKSSAAHAAGKRIRNMGLTEARNGLVQVVADNFDANISSQNGLQSTHALAMLVTQNKEGVESKDESISTEIRRIEKHIMKEDIVPDIPMHHYQGPKNPDMPKNVAKRIPLPLRILAGQVVSVSKAKETDFEFMKKIATMTDVPEFGGFNTMRTREKQATIKPKTNAVYLPLVDMNPTNPTTIMTAMVEAERVTNQTGQEYTLFTNDQQLYKITVGITWVYQERFLKLIPRLGGMHTLMSFVGAVGSLMSDSGLESIMESAFGGVSKMLSGKKFPQNVRALRMVAEELLAKILRDEHVTSESKLMEILEDRAKVSRTAKVWLENLVKPVFIIMMFIRAEREGNWPLHLYATEQMMPYFFASGHVHYARYGLYYLHSMAKLPSSVLEEFLNGNHVM